MKKKSIVLPALVCCLMALGACKKNSENGIQHELVGKWNQIDLGGHQTRIGFTKKLGFEFVASPNDQPNAGTVLLGSYAVDGNKLLIKVDKKDTSPNEQLYENATYSIKNDTLTLNYTSYPADVPVPSVAKFKKLLDFGDDIIR